jgi:hypothetical protein
VGKGGKKKNWPRSWKQAAATGGTLTLKGRGFEKELVVLPLRVEAESPTELAERVEEVLIEATKKEPES